MQVQVWQIIVLTLWIGIGQLDALSFAVGMNGIIQTGIFTGIIIGQPATGLFVGGSLQLMSLGIGTYGGASVPNYTTAAMLATVFVSPTLDAPTAIAMYGVPIAALTIQFDVLGRMANTFFQQKADKYVLKADFEKITLMNTLGCIPWFLSRAIPVFIALAIGPTLVTFISDVVPSFITSGFTIAGKMLPAVGFTILLRYLPAEKNIQYVILGFVLSAYLKLDILGVALIGAVIALTIFQNKTSGPALATGSSDMGGDDGYDE